ncbi:Methyltransferase-like protein 23 [Entomophthora muscae]|uniref:Methyltransferase-like protein 23 n=1 Tax=Entomophthora muscae TaxID=34485 RepID=A0ACC2SY89_9FUNG|nr:Methyltransferase-like protein 23 [Entomophthora muscae]
MSSKGYREISFILPENETNDPREITTLKIYEILDSGFGCHLWPASIYLADYLWRERAELVGRSIVELGAGCGLAGLVCAKLGASSILTDHPNNTLVLANCIKNVNVNQLEACCQVKSLAWGRFTKDILELPKIDYIIGSDTFYDRKDFEPLLATVAFLIEQNPDAVFLTAYQERRSCIAKSMLADLSILLIIMYFFITLAVVNIFMKINSKIKL